MAVASRKERAFRHAERSYLLICNCNVDMRKVRQTLGFAVLVQCPYFTLRLFHVYTDQNPIPRQPYFYRSTVRRRRKYRNAEYSLPSKSTVRLTRSKLDLHTAL